MFYEIVSRIIQLLYATYKMYQDEKVISSDGQIFVEFRGTSQTSTTVRSIIRQRPQVAGWWRLLTPNRSYVDEAQQLYSNAMFFKHFSSSLYCCFMHTISLLLLLMFTYFLVVWLYHAHAKTQRFLLRYRHTHTKEWTNILPREELHAKQIPFYEIKVFVATKNMQAGIQTNHASLSVFEIWWLFK